MAEDDKVAENATGEAPETPEKIKDKAPGMVELGGDMIKNLNEATERRENANKVTEQLILRQEALIVQQKIGGGSPAGQGNIEPPKEETPEEYKDRIMKGDIDGKKE